MAFRLGDRIDCPIFAPRNGELAGWVEGADWATLRFFTLNNKQRVDWLCAWQGVDNSVPVYCGNGSNHYIAVDLSILVLRRQRRLAWG